MFTSKKRDGETGIDYLSARYFSGAQDRLTSPDAPFADQQIEDPQSWNLYSYVRSNPLAHIDSDGRACFSIAGFGNTGSGFCQRAETYARFDSMVADKTRFSSAVSAATQALADVAVPVLGGAGTSPDTRLHNPERVETNG
jgi:RHS repeat-associated protein